MLDGIGNYVEECCCVRRTELWLRGEKDCCVNCVGKSVGMV